MMSFAQITLIGHVGRDPELTYTPEGVAVTRFSLAVSKKEGKEGKERTTWFNCTATGASAALATTLSLRPRPASRDSSAAR